MRNEPVIFLAFANDRDDYLENLQEEEHLIYNHLLNLHDSNCIEIFPRFQTTLDSIFQHFSRYRNRIAIFHYGGHAGSTQLRLGDGDAQSQGLAKLMGLQENLQLVFLNGCSTKGQVKQLLKNNVKAVIATSVKINDKAAVIFADQFYSFLANGSSIKEAFHATEAYFQAKDSLCGIEIAGCRNLVFEDDDEEEELSWGLYYEKESAINWRIPKEDLPQVVESNPLYDYLTRLNFSQQNPLLRKYLRRNDFGAFLIHGPPNHGQHWLGINILKSLKDVGQLELSPTIRFGINTSDLPSFVKALKKWLRAGFGFSDLETEIESIAEKLCDKLSKKSVLIRIQKAGFFLMDGNKGLLNELVEQFWVPLVERIKERQAEIRENDSEVVFFKLVLGLIEEEQTFDLDHPYFCSEPGKEAQELSILHLPSLQPIHLEEFKQWVEYDFNYGNGILAEKFEDRFDDDDDYRNYLNNSEIIPCIPLIEKICEEFGYYFEQKETGDWIITT